MKKEEKELYIGNGNLHWLLRLYEEYRKTTDQPDFDDFISWLTL